MRVMDGVKDRREKADGGQGIERRTERVSVMDR